MNQRILQLALQAKFDSVIMLAHYGTDGFLTDSEQEQLDQIEKFAELIINHATECVRDVLRDEDSELTYGAATQVQNKIKQFFGV